MEKPAVVEETSLESYFQSFRENIVGIDQEFESPYGTKKIIYADWTASGRLYRPIEEKLLHQFGPFVANTHTETTVSGTTMTHAYKEARSIIKNHVNAGEDDILITTGTGMTGAVNKLQRILGLRVPEQFTDRVSLPKEKRPVVFVSHMEHHSNQTSWLETLAEVKVVPCNEEGLFCLHNLEDLLEEYNDRPLKIVSVTGCSNVTGIKTPYHEIAKLAHANNGFCFVDFACSAPYVDIDMNPKDPSIKLDAVFFSPHKFLGGPGSSGVLVFHKSLYKNSVPDCPGGGTVDWTNPWGLHKYLDDIEGREDGGTPGFLQVIRAALAIRLKEKMGTHNILKREEELLAQFFERFQHHDSISILAGNHVERFAVVSFTVKGLYHDLAVKLLNDRFGIQTRGGCSCAGTYGHHLLEINRETSDAIIEKISCGMSHEKPGWVRISFHPTTTNAEMEYICDSLDTLAENHEDWAKEYRYENGRYLHSSEASETITPLQKDWFSC
ncbi:aminotransferase class V-fold PLP-dependent enzyme [Flavobacteriaceae bacterium TK19130]|nr:aminotransferase class V-fold PLP-dependent enzyme [Thermobacterium salinum]